MRLSLLLLILLSLASAAHAAPQSPPTVATLGMPFVVTLQATGPAELALGIGMDGETFLLESVVIDPPSLVTEYLASIFIPAGVTATAKITIVPLEIGMQRLYVGGQWYAIEVTRPAAPPPLRRLWLPLTLKEPQMKPKPSISIDVPHTVITDARIDARVVVSPSYHAHIIIDGLLVGAFIPDNAVCKILGSTITCTPIDQALPIVVAVELIGPDTGTSFFGYGGIVASAMMDTGEPMATRTVVVTVYRHEA